MSVKTSVIIPLYNKVGEVGRAVRSVLGQTCAPVEIIVVDDGSTDGSAAAVESIGSPLVRLVRQENAGVSAARNRGMAEAQGDYYAFLDADDEWQPRFLEKIAELTEKFPACGLYCTGFDITRGGRNTGGGFDDKGGYEPQPSGTAQPLSQTKPDGKSHPAAQPAGEGIVEDYFESAMSLYVASGSSSVIPARVIKEVGGFPDGMKLGEDQYMWTKIALSLPVCFTPEKLVRVHTAAANRSSSIYTPEQTSFSFRDFLGADGPVLDEYIARVELGKAITATVRGGTEEGLKAESDFAYNRRSRRLWHRLRILNRLPAAWRPAVNSAYSRLAWAISKKGL